MEKQIFFEDDGIRLDRWFKRRLPNLQHALLQKALRKGQVRLDGKKAEANTRIASGQKLSFPDEWMEIKAENSAPVKRESTSRVTPNDVKDLEQRILFEDADMLVLNKPYGLAVQGGTGQSISVDAIMRKRAEMRKEQPPRLVHRLDRDTSGVLVLGKHANAAAELARAFARKDAAKFYWALISGVPSVLQGTIDLAIAKKVMGKDSRMEKVAPDEDGKKAVTHYEVLDNAGRTLSFVELMPVTGRTHQLRVHMEAIGHPIIGDGKYGGAEAFIDSEHLAKKLHLHARRLVLPYKGKDKVFVAPLTGHMKQSFALFGFSEKG